jgi:hypothetical protein
MNEINDFQKVLKQIQRYSIANGVEALTKTETIEILKLLTLRNIEQKIKEIEKKLT